MNTTTATRLAAIVEQIRSTEGDDAAIGVSPELYLQLCRELGVKSITRFKGMKIEVVMWQKGQSPTEKRKAVRFHARRKDRKRRSL